MPKTSRGSCISTTIVVNVEKAICIIGRNNIDF
ncbi:unnamed protein product, partial [marine sediment metagenome]